MTTKDFGKIWKAFPGELKKTLKLPHDAFYGIINDRFGGKWKMESEIINKQIETDFPKKIEGDVKLSHFTNFSITINNEKIMKEDEKSCYTRWKDISFSPIFPKKNEISICVRDGYTKEKLMDNGKYIESYGDGADTSLEYSIVDISAFDNEVFINFINRWMTQFPKKYKAIRFRPDGNVITN